MPYITSIGKQLRQIILGNREQSTAPDPATKTRYQSTEARPQFYLWSYIKSWFGVENPDERYWVFFKGEDGSLGAFHVTHGGECTHPPDRVVEPQSYCFIKSCLASNCPVSILSAPFPPLGINLGKIAYELANTVFQGDLYSLNGPSNVVTAADAPNGTMPCLQGHSGCSSDSIHLPPEVVFAILGVIGGICLMCVGCTWLWNCTREQEQEVSLPRESQRRRLLEDVEVPTYSHQQI